MALNFNPPLTDVLKTGEPVQKGQLSALFGVLRDAVNSLELFLQDVGVWTVTAVGGTANAITGTLGFAEDADTVILLVPLADNGPGGVTLKLGSGPTRGIQKTDGTGLAPGDLKQGQPVMLRVTAAGPWRVIASGVLWSAVMAAVDAEAAARISAIRDTGVLPLANVAGTANAVTADIAPALGSVTLSTLSTVELIPSADNTGPVTLAVGGSAPWPVSRRDGTPLQAGDLKTNVSYLLRRRSNTWRLIGLLDSEVASQSALRSSQRRVFSRDVTLSATEITVKLPPGLNPSITENTLIDILWPDAPWPVPSNTNISVRVTDSAGTVLRSGIARLDRGAAPGPKPGAWWTITAKVGTANDEWQHISRQPTQADVDSRALASDVSARFAASLLGHRQLTATRDASVTGSLRLVLAEEPASSERIVIVIPEDAPGPGLSISTPARTRSAGMLASAAATVPTATSVRFKAGDIVTLQVHDSSWFRIHALWGGTRLISELQSKAAALEADLAAHKANASIAVRQEGASLPARPAGARYVEWYTWSDPSARMQPWDKWIKMPNPTVPGIPTAAELQAMAFDGGAGGATSIRFMGEIAEKLPALTAIQYQVDGGAWKDLGAPPFGIGTVLPMAAMTPADHQLSFRFANYLGTGEPSPARPVRAHGSVFADDFALPLNWTAGRLNGRDNWGPAHVSAPSASDVWPIVNGNEVTASALNARSVIHTTWDSLSGAGGAGLFVQGVISRTASATRDILVALARKNAEAGDNIRLGKDSANWRLVVAGGVVASGPLPANVTDTFTGRLEVTPDGLKIRAYIDGELVATVDNPFASGALLFPGLYYSAPSSSTATGTATVRDFSAGRVAA